MSRLYAIIITTPQTKYVLTSHKYSRHCSRRHGLCTASQGMWRHVRWWRLSGPLGSIVPVLPDLQGVRPKPVDQLLSQHWFQDLTMVVVPAHKVSVSYSEAHYGNDWICRCCVSRVMGVCCVCSFLLLLLFVGELGVGGFVLVVVNTESFFTKSQKEEIEMKTRN